MDGLIIFILFMLLIFHDHDSSYVRRIRVRTKPIIKRPQNPKGQGGNYEG